MQIDFKRGIFFILCSLFAASAHAEIPAKFTSRLAIEVEQSGGGQRLKAWIFLADKGNQTGKARQAFEDGLLPEARERRLRNPDGPLSDFRDLPVFQPYLQKIRTHSLKIRHTSRWLNAVSVEATGSVLTRLAQYAFVSEIDRMVHHHRAARPVDGPQHVHSAPSSTETLLDYGDSFDQNNLINVPPLHQAGLSGSGIIICMMDAGFNNLQHEALDHLNIVAAYDFVNGDANVFDEPGQSGSGNHGTNTLSAIGGFQEGSLIGPAYNADYILAKTENSDTEMHLEEDNWVAAAEWADSLGADIISSSVGYLDIFANYGEIDYTWEDMDGRTTIVSIGAEIAASRGILLVNSVGNEGIPPAGQNSLIAPADAEHVLAIGATDNVGEIASFSSRGPTIDGRIKPDILAMGVQVVLASATGSDRYVTFNGTSFSCPQIAGVAALLLEAEPLRSNQEITTALLASSDNALHPDNVRGWGVVNAESALSILRGDLLNPPVPKPLLESPYPNPFTSTTTLVYRLARDSQVVLRIFNILGQPVANLVENFQSAALPGYVKIWNSAGMPPGMYFAVLLIDGEQRAVQKLLVVH